MTVHALTVDCVEPICAVWVPRLDVIAGRRVGCTCIGSEGLVLKPQYFLCYYVSVVDPGVSIDLRRPDV